MPISIRSAHDPLASNRITVTRFLVPVSEAARAAGEPRPVTSAHGLAARSEPDRAASWCYLRR